MLKLTSSLGLLLCLPWCVHAQTVRAVPTFHNLGLEVQLDAAAPTSVGIELTYQVAGAAGTRIPGHPLTRLSSTLFAGSLLGLESGTEYEVQLESTAFISNIVVCARTRSDSFPEATNRILHVSASSGDDGHSGSSLAEAWRTLGHAIAQAQAGDRILLHEGRYCEGDLVMPRSGTATAPIVLENAPGETAVVDGTDPDFSPSWTLFEAEHALYRAPCTATPANAYLNGEHFYHYLSLEDLRTNRWEQGSGFHTDGSHLYARFPGNAPPGTNRVTLPRFTTGLTIERRHDVHLRGLEFCYFGYGTYHRAIYIDGGDSNLVDQCRFHHSVVGVALKRAADFNTIQHCEFVESPLSTWSWHAVKSGEVGYEAGGVIVYASSEPNEGNVIRFNRFTDMFDAGHLYSDASGPTRHLDFHHNLVARCADDGLETDGAGSNVRICGNRFTDFLTGVSVAPCAGGPTYIFRNTLSDWHTVAEFEGYPFKFNVSSSLPIEWVYLYHNTCSTRAEGQNGFLFKQYSRWTNVISRNNIFAGTRCALESWSDVNPVDFDFDNLYTSDPNRLIRWAGSSYASLADFIQGTGQEAHGLSVEPVFLDATNGDFYLGSGSPLLDRGCTIPGINHDHLGGAPDIGAYEHGMRAIDITVSNGVVTAVWQVAPGQVYQWQGASNLDAPDWIDRSNAITALLSVIRTSDPVSTTTPSFYRLKRVGSFP